MDLKELLGEELYNQVKEKIGDKKLIVNDGTYIPKAKFDEKNEELKSTKLKMDELEQKVKDLGESSEEANVLKDKLKELKGEYEQFKSESEKRITDTQKRQAIERSLVKAEANPDTIDLLVDKFDIDKIQLDSKGEIVDWELHLNPVKEQRKTLFGEVKITGDKPPSGGDPTGANPFKQGEEFNLTEQGRLVINEPDKAKSLILAAGKNPQNYGL